ncbi:MAG: DUF2807 domain-containing protein [Sphingomonas sp.]
MYRLAPLLLLGLTASAAPVAQDRTFLVSGFDRLRVDGPFQVELVVGPTRATATGDPQALQRLQVRVDGGTLVVGAGTEGWGRATGAAVAPPRITLSTPALRTVLVNGGGQVRVAAMKGARIDLGLNGGGSLVVAGIDAADLGVTLTGTGTMTLAGSTRQVRVRSNGAGSIDAAGLTAGDAVLVSESSGGLRIGVRYSAQVFAMGLGPVEIDGKPECRISGSGPVRCDGRVTRR